ncbi:hypothetical protein HMSSN139_57590 [Paenibacillus sp. HMSSN-139]|nr:hypothetical protein HMSSN139_57590 [Paenibacillus sp. HMSSN-139]
MKKTWLLGLGFFSISLTWALYNAFVPLFWTTIEERRHDRVYDDDR